MRFLKERIVAPSTSTSTISNGAPSASNVASTRAISSGTSLSGTPTDATRETLQPRYDGMQELGDLSRAVDEHVEVAARGVEHVFARLEIDLVQAHPRQPIGERRAVVRKVARQTLERRRARR